MRFQKISYLAVLALSCAAVAAPHPDPQDNGSLTNTVPIAWHDVEAGAYAVQSSNTVDPKRSVDESEHISFAHSKSKAYLFKLFHSAELRMVNRQGHFGRPFKKCPRTWPPWA